MGGISRSSSVVPTFNKVSFFNRLLHQITSKYAYSIGFYSYDICGYHYSDLKKYTYHSQRAERVSSYPNTLIIFSINNSILSTLFLLFFRKKYIITLCITNFATLYTESFVERQFIVGQSICDRRRTRL